MTAQILNIRDYQLRRDMEEKYSEFANQVAAQIDGSNPIYCVEIANVALIPMYESSLGYVDTSPCEMNCDSGDGA